MKTLVRDPQSWTLISLLLLASFAIQARAQGPLFGQRGGSPKLREKSGAAQKGNTPGSAYSVLYSFCSAPACADGDQPSSVLIEDGAGNLYGTTVQAGANFGGTVFMVDQTGQETSLYNFCAVKQGGNCADGSGPYAGVIQDEEGNLYGTTVQGGANGQGTVFRIDKQGTGGRAIQFLFGFELHRRSESL